MPLVRSQGARAYGLAKKCRRLSRLGLAGNVLPHGLRGWGNCMPPLRGWRVVARGPEEHDGRRS
jgi:hypothetical protein